MCKRYQHAVWGKHLLLERALGERISSWWLCRVSIISELKATAVAGNSFSSKADMLLCQSNDKYTTVWQNDQTPDSMKCSLIIYWCSWGALLLNVLMSLCGTGPILMCKTIGVEHSKLVIRVRKLVTWVCKFITPMKSQLSRGLEAARDNWT